MENPIIQFSRFTGAASATVPIIVNHPPKIAGGEHIENCTKNRGNFLRISPSQFGGAYGGALPHEYEVDMLDGISY